MKAIERDMLDAMYNGEKKWYRDNTRISLDATLGYNYYYYVYLHENFIAEVCIDIGYPKISSCSVWYPTLREYPTVTTKSRLRALGVNVYTKAYTTYIDGKSIN